VFSTAHLRLAANVETLVLQGSADLQGYGNSQSNIIYGNSGSNLIDGGSGADMMFGRAGNDVYVVDDAGDAVFENPGEGSDAVFAAVSYTLTANVETLVLQGAGNLSGTGNALANGLYGNSGDNALDGGAGADVLTGNAGNDTFVFHRGQGNGDMAVDFAGNGAAQGDSLQFVGYGAGATFTKVDATALAGQFQRRLLARNHHLHERRGDRCERRPVLLRLAIILRGPSASRRPPRHRAGGARTHRTPPACCPRAQRRNP
jgi:Ca2+-binding RTX toxin-like protein